MKLKKFNTKGYEKLTSGTLQVGDVVIVKIRLFDNVRIYEIDRVTKTMGICKTPNYDQRFRVGISGIRSYPVNTWDTNTYLVYRKSNERTDHVDLTESKEDR